MPVAFGLVGLVLLGALGYQVLRLRQAAGPTDYGPAPSFVLTDHLGRIVDSRQFLGKVVVANFIYTRCPDFCPLLSLRMQGLQDRLAGEGLLGQRVQLLSFTVDPARDTPDLLRAYAERHRAHPDFWRFLTGPEDVMLPLLTRGFFLGIEAEPLGEEGHGEGESGLGYVVTHGMRFVLIGPDGRVRAYYDGLELNPDQVVSAVQQLSG